MLLTRANAMTQVPNSKTTLKNQAKDSLPAKRRLKSTRIRTYQTANEFAYLDEKKREAAKPLYLRRYE
jgi:hypothetical protein